MVAGGWVGVVAMLFLLGCAASDDDDAPEEAKPPKPDAGGLLPPLFTPEGLDEESQRLVGAAQEQFGDSFELNINARLGEQTGTNVLSVNAPVFLPLPFSRAVFVVGFGTTQESSSAPSSFFVGSYEPDLASLGFFVFGLTDHEKNALVLPLLDSQTGEVFTVVDYVRWVSFRFQKGVESVAVHCNSASTPPCQPPLDAMEWVFEERP